MTADMSVVRQLKLGFSMFSQGVRVRFVSHFPPLRDRDAGWLPPLSSPPFFILQIPQKRHKSVRGGGKPGSKAQQAEECRQSLVEKEKEGEKKKERPGRLWKLLPL